MTSPEPSFAVLVLAVDGSLFHPLFACCFNRPFCMFLSLNDILPLGGSDHSVLDTITQLTEGRSARDQPKQPPAKKSTE